MNYKCTFSRIIYTKWPEEASIKLPLKFYQYLSIKTYFNDLSLWFIYKQSLSLFIVIATGHSFIPIYTYNLVIVI